MKHLADRCYEIGCSREQWISDKFPASNQLEERFHLAVRSERVRQVVKVGLCRPPASFGNIGWDRNAGRNELIGDREPVGMWDRFDDVEADIREVHAGLPDRQILERVDATHARTRASRMPARFPRH